MTSKDSFAAYVGEIAAADCEQLIVVTLSQPLVGTDLDDGNRFFSNRHKVLASAVRQDCLKTTMVNRDGEIVGEWPTRFVESIIWPMQERPHSSTDSRPSDWSTKLIDIRKRFPNAFRRWTVEQEEALNTMFSDGSTVREMSEVLGRGSGGIIARLTMLGLINEGATEIDVNNRRSCIERDESLLEGDRKFRKAQ